MEELWKHCAKREKPSRNGHILDMTMNPQNKQIYGYSKHGHSC